MRQPRVNPAYPCREWSFTVVWYISERRTVTAEAAGSSPVVPAILLKHLQP